MVGALGSQAEARSVGKPKPASFGLLAGNLQPLTPPDALDPFVVDHPARLVAQERGDPAVAIAAVTAGKLDDVLGQLRFIVPAARAASLCGAMLAKSPADPAFGDLLRQNRVDMVDTGAATRGA